MYTVHKYQYEVTINFPKWVIKLKIQGEQVQSHLC